MAEKKTRENTILFPGISVVYTQEVASCQVFKIEHKSRSSLHNVMFRIYMDLDCGKQDIYHPENHGTLQCCYNLDRLFEGDPDFDYKGLVNRLYVRIDKHLTDKDMETGQKLHIFMVKQLHAKYDLIMDW
jgi:hypothetical protein